MMAARVHSLASGSVLEIILAGGLYPQSGNCHFISGMELLTAVFMSHKNAWETMLSVPPAFKEQQKKKELLLKSLGPW